MDTQKESKQMTLAEQIQPIFMDYQMGKISAAEAINRAKPVVRDAQRQADAIAEKYGQKARRLNVKQLLKIK